MCVEAWFCQIRSHIYTTCEEVCYNMDIIVTNYENADFSQTNL